MFISVFYAVVDPRTQQLCYANSGHPHAFVLTEGKEFVRLAATDPPLGMGDAPPLTARRHWTPEKDLLVLFTDGVSDARNRAGDRLGEERVLETIKAHRQSDPEEILERVLELLDRH